MGPKFHFRDSRITLFHPLHTCTAFWLQNGITSSRFGIHRSHFGFQSVPGRARPARPDGRAGWPSLAGPGWPARPPGPACRPVGCSAGEGRRRGQGKGKRQRAGEPPPPLLSPQVGYFITQFVYEGCWNDIRKMVEQLSEQKYVQG